MENPTIQTQIPHVDPAHHIADTTVRSLPVASAAAQNNRANIRAAQIAIWKRALKVEVGGLLLINFSLLAALISDSGSSCPGHNLKTWSVVEIIVQTLLIFPSLLLQVNMESFFRQAETRKLEPVAILYTLSRILNIFWIIWGVVGIVWTFQAKGCGDYIPAVYTMCFILAIVNCILVGLPLVLCCLSIPGGLAMYYLYPRFFGIEPIIKASPKLIKKVTRLETFKPGCIPTEDACCAICLCEYQEGDEMRYLNCSHHFHSECVTDWLMRNKVCPFCKTEIDKKIKPLAKVVVESRLEEEQPLTSDTAQLIS
jgi:hypothetical protein